MPGGVGGAGLSPAPTRLWAGRLRGSPRTELLGIGDNEAFDLGGLIGSVIGVIILLFIYERVVKPKPKAA